MNKLRGIIIDDEKNNRQVLKKLVKSFCSNVDIIDETDNIEDAFTKIEAQQPDFIFLDIQMPGGNGFDLLKKFKSIQFEIIFITSFDKYAIQAFKYSAIDYLLKPVEINELIASVNKVAEKAKQKQNTTHEQVVYLLNNLDKEVEEKHIALQHADKVRYIKLSDIVLFEADRSYTKIITIQDESYIHSKSLKYFEDLLIENKHFFRATKSDLINLNFIKEYSKTEPCILSLKNGTYKEISRRKKGEFLELMDKR
jgi:two-component system, LytTR family, response regulator